MRWKNWSLQLFGWLLAAWIATSSPAFASVPDPFRPVRVHVEEIQILYVPYAAFGLGTTTYEYDSRDSLTGANLLGGVAASFSYDALNRPASWSVSKSGSNLLARSCTRNGLGFKETESITAGLETLDGPPVQAHQHNEADQITSVLRGGPEATNLPSFDPCGNMTQVVLRVKGQTFTTQYRYDADNKLLGVSRLRNNPQGQSVTTSVVQLEYDAQRLLLRITENGTVRRLVRDRVDQLARPLVETDASGNTVRWFVWANGRLLAQVGTNSVIRVAHVDELGRVVAFTDSNGALVDEFCYSPYGRLIAHSGTTATPLTWLGAFGVWDAGHGLYLTRHRAYDANLARFASRDPAGLAGGFNLYALANGSPLALIDVLGLCPDSSSSREYSWGQGGSQSYSSYNGAVLRSSSEAAAPFYTDALLLGSSISPATPAGQSMAFSQAAGYLTAPGGEMLGSAIGSAVSRIISKVATPVAKSMPSTLYHYTSAGNAESIAQSGLGTSGRQVYTTPAGSLSPVQAQIELALPPNRGYPSALFEIDTARLQQLGINPVAGPQRVMSTPTAGGGGVEYIFNQPIPSSAIRQVPFP